MKIPFVGGSNAGRSTQWNATRSINLFVERGADDSKAASALVGTPGTSVFATFPSGLIRMVHKVVDRCFVVAGADLYELYTDGTYSASLGTFPAPLTTMIASADNGVAANGVGGDQILMVANGLGYIYNTDTEVFAHITDANFPTDATEVAFMDGYFIVTDVSMKFKTSALYDGLTWPALALASATSTPDDIKKPFALNQQLYLIKESTTELWYNNETATTQGCPFARMSGGMINFGTSASRSVARCGDMTLMLATTRVRDSAVYFGIISFSGTAMTKISTAAIDYRISQLTTLSDAIAYSYVCEGHLFYVLTFPTDDVTFVYDLSTQEWHERSSYVAGEFKQHRHLSNEYVFFAGKHLVSHYSSPIIYEMSSAYYDDAGDPITRIRIAPPVYDPDEKDNVKIFKLVIDFEAGVGLSGTDHNSTPTAWLSWSNDGGMTWSAEYPASMGKQGEYKTRLVWRSLGSSRNRVFKLRIADAVKVVLLDAIVNDGAVY